MNLVYMKYPILNKYLIYGKNLMLFLLYLYFVNIITIHLGLSNGKKIQNLIASQTTYLNIY